MILRIRRNNNTPRTIVTAAFIVIGLAFGVWSYLQLQRPADAADLRNFDPSNIMSDSVMSNKNSMTEAQIQTFLESKNPCNNTNISKASVYHKVKDGRFVCMYEDTFNGETAAHIIWQAAQDYSINPQVIIVLLQKEQGLITDTWPNSIQYNKATGYGCPDTAACDAQYYGLKNQIRQAANLFRNVLNGGWTNYPVGNNYVQYNPNTACGGTTINIKNRATSALYRYTPYQPNQSALNAGYGAGDSCGAYGNRNFWLYFTDWFGLTTDIIWSPMKYPRLMTVVNGTLKINPATSELDSNWLEPGSDLYLTSGTNIVFGGEMMNCLRTQHDTVNNINRCVLMPRLKEYEPVFENILEKDRAYVIIQETCKYEFVYQKSSCEDTELYYGRIIEAVAKTNVLGIDYLVTKYDYDNKEGKTGIRLDRTTPYGQPSQDIPEGVFVDPTETDKSRVVIQYTCKIWVSTAQPDCNLERPLNSKDSLDIAKKIKKNGVVYYVTKHDWENNSGKYMLRADRTAYR